MKRRFGIVASAAMLACLGISALSPSAAGTTASAERPGTSNDPRALAVSQARQALAQHADAAQRSEHDKFSVLRVLTDPNGATHVRMQRLFKGVPLSGGQVIVHNSPSGVFEGVTTTIDDALRLSTEPTVSAERAKGVAKHEFEGSIAKVSNPKLVVDASAEPRLAWETVVSGTKPDGQTPSELHVTVNAADAGVIASWNAVNSAEGSGDGIYNGEVTFTTTKTGSGYEMVDPKHGDGSTRNADDGSQVYTDSDNVWPDRAAVDVHYGVGKTYDYFVAKHDFAGPAGDGAGIPRNVHVRGRNYCNAFYNGSSINFGDCRGNPLTAIDIAAHEFSHGITDHTAGLRYTDYDSGGLNEATSDIFGTLVEFYSNSPGDTPDYKIGEEIPDTWGREALRYMYDPNLNPRSYNCYEQDRAADPHFTSGVANHFFYLLVQGSQPADYPSSPTCNDSTVDGGIGNAKGGEIWFRALSRYMGPSETYPEAAEATAKAAEDLYGVCGAEYQQVQQAWAAVSIDGVGQPCDEPPQDPGKPVAQFAAECSAAEPACSFDASGSSDENGSISSYAWKFGDGASGAGKLAEHTYADAGKYEVTLTVTDNEGNTASATKSVTAGTPRVAELPNGAPDIALDTVRGHLEKLQAVADNNGGHRSTGSAGYVASTNYVEKQVRSYGYRVNVQEFSTRSGDSANVLATLPGDDPSKVVMLGAHLDSVSRGPGINDNGSGSAALLALAEAFAKANPDPPVTVRFGWWGAEEQGLLGSNYYVEHLSSQKLDRIDAYLNFDMLGSVNTGYFIYSNNERLHGVLGSYFETMNWPTEATDINGRSDHASFARAGVDVAGLFTGAGAQMSRAQAQKWNGTAGQAFDQCYHSRCDTIENISWDAMERNSDAVSYSLWEMAGTQGSPPDDPGAPVAEFATECSASELVCSFDGSGSSAPDGSIASYAWDFGDGSTGSGVSVRHTYAEAGSYSVTLTVTDDAGNTDSVTEKVSAGTPPSGEKPSASFTVNCQYTGGCTFDGGTSSDDRGITAYSWDFGDEATGSGTTVQHEYQDSGWVTATLTVTDKAGQTDTAQQRMYCTDFGQETLCYPQLGG